MLFVVRCHKRDILPTRAKLSHIHHLDEANTATSI